MTVSLALSILLVYLLMVALYNGYVTPFIIMFTVRSQSSARSVHLRLTLKR